MARQQPVSEDQLLRAVYRHLDVQGLAAELPGVSKQRVDELFRRMAGLVRGKPATRGPRRVVLYTDGASKGNPGPAGAAFVLFGDDGDVLLERGDFIGRATSNVAEYCALKAGLECALEVGAQEIMVRSDSELMTRQLTGRYRVKHPRLRPLYAEVTELLERFKTWRVAHVPRERNARADALATAAVKQRRTVTEA